MQTYRRRQGFLRKGRKGTLAMVAPYTRSVAGEPGGMLTVSAMQLEKLHRLTSFPPDVPDLTRVSFCGGLPLTSRSCESRGEFTGLAASEVELVAVG
jgi:hypothetical protein